MNNLKENGRLLSLPIPLSDWTYKLLKLAKETNRE